MENTGKEDIQLQQPKKPRVPRRLAIHLRLLTALLWTVGSGVEIAAAAQYYKIVYVYGAVVPKLAEQFRSSFWLNSALAVLFFLLAAWYAMVGIALWQRRKRLLAQARG